MSLQDRREETCGGGTEGWGCCFCSERQEELAPAGKKNSFSAPVLRKGDWGLVNQEGSNSAAGPIGKMQGGKDDRAQEAAETYRMVRRSSEEKWTPTPSFRKARCRRSIKIKKGVWVGIFLTVLGRRTGETAECAQKKNRPENPWNTSLFRAGKKEKTNLVACRDRKKRGRIQLKPNRHAAFYQKKTAQGS